MQTLKRKWKSKDTVRKAVILSGFVLLIALAFLSSIPNPLTKVFAAGPVIVTSTHAACNGTVTCGITLNIYAGDVVILAISEAGSPNSCGGPNCGVVFSSCTDSGGQIWSYIGYKTDLGPPGGGSLYTNFCYATSTVTQSDTITVTNSVGSGSAGLEYTVVAGFDVTGPVSLSALEASGTTNCCILLSSLSFSQNDLILQAASDDCVGICNGATGFIWTASPAMSNFFTQTAGSFEIMGSSNVQRVSSTGASTFSMSNNNAGTDRHWTESVLDVASGLGTYTSTYSISWTNSTCVIPTNCTVTTTSTVITYDHTNTTVDIIECDHDPNCATFTQSTNKTITFTNSSVTFVTDTTTTTLTHTALNAPSQTSTQFWLIPLLFLLIPAFTIMAVIGETIGGSGGIVGFFGILGFFIGLDMGAIFGIFAKVMPWPVLVLTMILTVAVIIVERIT